MLATRFDLLPGERRVRVAQAGQGPPLVFLHGYPDNLQIWSEVADRLAGEYQTIVFDWPGMGYSGRWSGGATPFDMADRLASLLQHWEIHRAILVGADMGGQAALACAIRYPDKVQQLVVMNCLAFPDEQTSWEIRMLRRATLNRIALHLFPALVFDQVEKSSLPRQVRLPANMREDLWLAFRNGRVRDFIIRMCAEYEQGLPTLTTQYNRITCPTLILWGERDKHFGLGQAHRLQRSIPGAELQIVPGGQHWMAWHRPEEIAARIRIFTGEQH
jgi:pimeloyl-ACP methyl ester carboxylesterase